MTNADKIQAIEETAEEIGGKVRKTYSGRGMYGKECYAIDCSNPTECIEIASSKGLRGAKYDNMGLDYVVYWPSVGKEEKDASE